MAKKLAESRATYSVSIDPTKSIKKPIVLKRAGQRIAALVPITEYDQFLSWRKQQRSQRKREPQDTWFAKQEKIIRRELVVFERMKPELLKTHKDKWVAIHKGELVDFDDDESTLAKRVYGKFGYRTILMKQVTKVEEVYQVNYRRVIEL